MKTSQLLEARENASDAVAIVFSLASDWLRGWRTFSEPITKAIPEYLRHSIETRSVEGNYALYDKRLSGAFET